MAETLGVVFTLRAHTTRPISDCCRPKKLGDTRYPVRVK